LSDAFARRVANVRSPMLRDEFAVDAAASNTGFAIPFAALSPLDLFEFGGLAFVLAVLE